VKDIKVASSAYITKEKLFPEFSKWQEGYGAFSCSYKDKESIIRYIQHQVDHHREVTFMEEFEGMLKAAGVDYDPKHLG
jgi:putative transposase